MHSERQLLFVQGGGEGTHDDWDGKLVDSLRRELGHRFHILYPRMPRESDPSYDAWKPALAKASRTLKDGAIVVGHSVGGTILLRMLAEEAPPAKLAGIALIAAPFVGEGGWPADDWQVPPDLGARLPAGVAIDFYHGLEDPLVPPFHVDLYARVVPQARIRRLSGRDHQLNDDLREVAAVLSSRR